MFFLTIVFGSLFLVESTIGKTGYYAMFLLLIISPIFNYFNNAIGFPIRLWLSELAGRVIQAVGKKTEVIGNLIIVNGSEFSVDPACAGLQMMATSFIIGLFVLAYYQKKRAKPFSLLFVLSILCGTFVLNVIANLIRIVLLVLFDIKAESGFHDIVGICCLLLYVLFPLIQLTDRKSQ